MDKTMQMMSMITMFVPQQSAPFQGGMGAVAHGSAIMRGESLGCPTSSPMPELLSLSAQAMKMMARMARHGGRPHRTPCHHVRSTGGQMKPDMNRVQGLQREIGTLYSQLAQYSQSGDHASAAATMALIARDQQMQVAAFMGANV